MAHGLLLFAIRHRGKELRIENLELRKTKHESTHIFIHRLHRLHGFTRLLTMKGKIKNGELRIKKK